jgi:hypothetical protein
MPATRAWAKFPAARESVRRWNAIDLRFDALLVSPDPLFVTQANQLIALAARHAIGRFLD